MSYDKLAAADPYYDDFDQAKNFHRILFRPGRAVQARELTQAQTILQDQVTKFADNIFKQNSPVTGGQVTTNFNCYYVKLQATYLSTAIDVKLLENKLVKNATGTVIARVIAVAVATGSGAFGDPPTLILSYKSGNHFQDGDIIYDTASNLTVQAITTAATGVSSVASISQGVFYILGNFVQISPSTIILEKYNNSPSKRVGLTITETVYDYINDTSLLDPAVGASNYQAPGADRYVIALYLDTRPVELGDDQNFVELVRITNGSISNLFDGSVYNVIDDYFAKRDYETNGDYVVEDYKLTPRTTPISKDPSANTYTLTVGKGLAYVHGYRIQNATNVDLVSNRARTTESQNNTPVFIDYGSYFYVDTVRGGASGTFFDVTTAQPIDLHCVTAANANTYSAATYNSTVVATGYIRNFVYDHNTSDSDANTYVYRAFVSDIQNATLSANVVSATTNTVTFPNTYSDSNTSYVGVNISISNGTSAGDFRTITSYNGTTKVATVNQNWTVTPDTSSVFQLNFDIKDVDTIVYADKTSYPATIKGYANINSTGRVGGVSTGETILENTAAPELIYNVGAPYVASIKNASYNTQQLNRGVVFGAGGGVASVDIVYSGSYAGVIKHLGSTSPSGLSADVIKQNFLIVVTNSGSSSFTDGQVIPWTYLGGTVKISSDSVTATLSIPLANTGGFGFTATVLEKVYVTNADDSSHLLKYKNLITANTSVVKIDGTQVASYTYVDDTSLTSTGQIYIQHAGLVTPGSKQSLYLSDVKSIVKIIDTKDSGTVPNLSMLTNSTYDVTRNYTFNNGQQDSHYDHASITLNPGAAQPKGNLLVFVNYYQHTGGDGYFAISSYLNSQKPETYQNIPSYVSKHGTTYLFRDSIDFRPARLNATTTFQFKYNVGDSRYGVFIPTDLSTFTTDYTYYLGRKDKLVLTKDRSFKIIEGSPSVNPLIPTEPDGSLVIANLTHRPYTGYIPTESPSGTISDLSIDKVKHKRYTMQDIAGLENRINNIEYYASLNLLEQKTNSLQISDSYGLNRFKNGILVDDFSSFATADTPNNDFKVTINRRDRVMTATQNVQNFPLKSLATAYNMNNIDSSINLGYDISTDGDINYFTLPYTTANVISQKFASRTVNVNPFSFSLKDGYISLSPNVDNWVDTNYSPALLVIDPNLQVFQASNNINQMTNGDWKTIPGTTYTTKRDVENHGRFKNTYLPKDSQYYGSYDIGYTETATYGSQAQTNTFGAYDQVGAYALNNGYITDVSILPWMRPQQIVARGRGMLFNTSVNYYFDNINVNNYIRKANIIELTGVVGDFNEGDIIGYYSSGTFTPTARVVGVYVGSTNTRLYVAADQHTTTYTTNGVIQNGRFNASGTYTSNTAFGTLVSSSHVAGRIINAANNTTIQLSPLASSANNYYNGNTFYVCAGTGIGQSSNIAAYNGVTKTITLETGFATANDDIYSIGSFNTDEIGSIYGVFNLPANSFHNGQRTLRIDNRINNNLGTETTYAEGIYYAEGLQTTAQTIDYSASPSGAKGTFTSTRYRHNVLIADNFDPYDPVAQTFIVDKTNFPNGMFLNSVSFFFASKPTTDGSPIKLSIVGTQNGYPDGNILDHSVVSLTPDMVNVSAAPQYLDKTATTTFTFSAPVYIQPGTLYAFILKSNSNQYTLWTASNGDTALSSSVSNVPPKNPDGSTNTNFVQPSSITKISGAPYTGGLFTSQNSQTWTVDQNQSLMFVVDRCVFSKSTPTIQYVVPNKLPQRTLIDQSINYYLNANNLSGSTETISTTDVLVDAFNITTTDFLPTTTGIGYTYNATLVGGTAAGTTNINPGKFGTPTNDDIYLSDGKGERILIANSNTSFSLYAQLSTADDAVSPVISDAGLSVYSIKWNINNAELSNSVITLASGGTNYNPATTTVTVSTPTGSGASQAYAAANIVGGIIQSVYLTSNGAGYITTPTITVTDSSMAGSGASVIVTGETSKNGGNASAKYVTKKVVLDPTFDSGDLNVYLTAYRPVNTDINVYYKILNRNDTQQFSDSSWQLMTKINNSGSLYSQTRNDTYEFVFAPGTSGVDQGYVTYTSTTGQTYSSFSQFAIKVVLTSSDHTYVPFANDLRVIALPSNVNTSV
jgi:hypothetical protein